MRLTISISRVLRSPANILAQQSHVRIYVTAGIDTADVDISQAIRLLENCLNSNPDSSYDDPFCLTAVHAQARTRDPNANLSQKKFLSGT